MAEHSFGWIQEAGNYSGLKEVLRAMVPGTARNFRLITKIFRPMCRNASGGRRWQRRLPARTAGIFRTACLKAEA